MTTLRYEYAAEITSIDTDLAVPAELQRLCDGTRETTFDPGLLGMHRDGATIVDGRIELRCRPAPVVVVELTTEHDVTNAEERQIVASIRDLFESDWNYEFDLPPALAGCQVHFETRPRVSPLDTTTPEIDQLATEWPGVTFEQMTALSDEALDALLVRLRRVAPAVRYDWRTPERAAVRSLLEAAETQKQRRAVERLAHDRPNDDDFI